MSADEHGDAERNEAWRRDVADELADHLDAAASRESRPGESEDETRRRVLGRFGSVAAAVLRCWWVHYEETIMQAAVRWLLTLATLIAGCVAALFLYRAQDALTTEVGAIQTRLGELADAQQKLVDLQQSVLDRQLSDAPSKITGRLHLADPSVPATGLTVKLSRKNDDQYSRETVTDAEGRFRFGALPLGGYGLFIDALTPDGEETTYTLESQDIDLFEGSGEKHIDLNVGLINSEIVVDFLPPLSEERHVVEGRSPPYEGDLEIAYELQIAVIPNSAPRNKDGEIEQTYAILQPQRMRSGRTILFHYTEQKPEDFLLKTIELRYGSIDSWYVVTANVGIGHPNPIRHGPHHVAALLYIVSWEDMRGPNGIITNEKRRSGLFRLLDHQIIGEFDVKEDERARLNIRWPGGESIHYRILDKVNELRDPDDRRSQTLKGLFVTSRQGNLITISPDEIQIVVEKEPIRQDAPEQ